MGPRFVHSHDLDGRLHDACPMCALIVLRRTQAEHDAKALASLDRERERAVRAVEWRRLMTALDDERRRE